MIASLSGLTSGESLRDFTRAKAIEDCGERGANATLLFVGPTDWLLARSAEGEIGLLLCLEPDSTSGNKEVALLLPTPGLVGTRPSPYSASAAASEVKRCRRLRSRGGERLNSSSEVEEQEGVVGVLGLGRGRR